MTTHAPDTAPLPEAAFSLCLKGRLAGIDAQLTVRRQSYSEFVTNVAAVRGLLDHPHEGAPQAATNGSTPDSPAQQSQPTLAGWCSIHGVQMTLQSNERGSWYSHKMPDGWCRGKERHSA